MSRTTIEYAQFCCNGCGKPGRAKGATLPVGWVHVFVHDDKGKPILKHDYCIQCAGITVSNLRRQEGLVQSVAPRVFWKDVTP